MIEVKFTCQDCGVQESTFPPEPPNRYTYGVGINLYPIRLPPSWNKNINQCSRCAACYARYIESMTPVWKTRDTERYKETLSKYQGKTPRELAEMVRKFGYDTNSDDTKALAEVLESL